MFHEAKDYVNAQFTTVRDLEEKAGQIIRFNAVVAGLIVAGVSIGGPSNAVEPIVAGLLSGGLALLVSSIAAAALAFRRSRMGLGIRSENLAAALDFETSERGFLVAAIEAYTRGIHDNIDRSAARTNRILSVSIAAVTAAVALLALAATTLIWSGVQ